MPLKPLDLRDTDQMVRMMISRSIDFPDGLGKPLIDLSKTSVTIMHPSTALLTGFE